VIVGRSRELALLEQTLDGATRGGAARLLLVGEAGIGKTALLDVAADSAMAQGFRVLRAGGLQGGQTFPYAVVSDLVRPAGASLVELSDADAAILGGLSAGTEASSARVGAALLQLVAVLAESGPLLVTVDDLHWADPGSRQALALAAGRLHAEPVAVLLATRPVAMDDPDLVRWQAVELGPLAPDDGLTLLRASVEEVIPEPVGRDLVAALGGNPLALRECGRILPVEVLTGGQPLPDPLPVGQVVQAAYARSVHKLSDRTARALLVLAVVGRGGVDLLVRVLGTSGLGIDDLDPAVAVRLLRIDPEHGPVPVHPLVRSAVYQDADPAVRREVHRLTAAAADELGLAPDLVVANLVKAAAGPDEAVAAAIAAQARRARAAGRHHASVLASEAAARLSPCRADKIARGVEAAWVLQLDTGDFADAGPLLDLLDGAQLADEDQLVVDWLRADYLCNTDLPGSLLAIVDVAERASRIGSDLEPQLWWDVAGAAEYVGDLSTAVRAAERLWRVLATRDERMLPAELVGVGAGALGRAALFSGDVARGVPLIEQAAAELDQASDDGVPGVNAWLRLNLVDQVIPRPGGAWDRRLERLEDRLAQDDPSTLGYLRAHTANRARLHGRWSSARADVDEAIELGTTCGQPWSVIMALAVGVLLDALTGDHERLATEAAHLRRACTAIGDRHHPAHADRAEGLLALAEGHLDVAVERLTAVADVGFCGLGITDTAMPAQVDLVEALTRSGERAGAAARMPRVEEWLTPMPDPLSAALLARTRGLVAEDPDQADRQFLQALAAHHTAGDPFEEARTRLLLGEHLRRTRRRTAARRELLAAAATFQQLGARPWLDRADAELRVCGVTGEHRERPEAVLQFTAQERRIAEAVAEGRSNREVASALFLSPRTVEYHLSNAYRKLGVTNRTGLAERLREAG
jgi:DNA-binding CsgD family transcriptional regulator